MQAIAATQQITALQLLLDNPMMEAQEWMQKTGLRLRSFYQYRSRAGAANSADDAPPSSSHDAADDTASEKQTRRSTRARVQIVDANAGLRNADQFGTALVQSTSTRNKILLGIFLAATAASVENMFRTISTFSADIFSNVALTAVFALTAMGFMLSGVRNRATIAIVAALVIFEALCNATAIFGGLTALHPETQQPNQFLQNITALLHFFNAKNVAQAIAIFCATCIAFVQFFSIKEVRNPHTETVRLVATHQ